MTRICLLLALLAIAKPLPLQERQKEKALAPLQGQWKNQWFEIHGKRKDAGDQAKVLEIKADKWVLDGQEIAVIAVDPTTSPTSITLTAKQRLYEAEAGQTAEGILKVEGDTFTVCFAKVRGEVNRLRPTAFSTGANPRLVMYEFKRSKK